MDGEELVVRTPGEPTAACDFSLIRIIESRVRLLQGLLQVHARQSNQILNSEGSEKLEANRSGKE